jgi:hypothetical protein
MHPVPAVTTLEQQARGDQFVGGRGGLGQIERSQAGERMQPEVRAGDHAEQVEGGRRLAAERTVRRRQRGTQIRGHLAGVDQVEACGLVAQFLRGVGEGLLGTCCGTGTDDRQRERKTGAQLCDLLVKTTPAQPNVSVIDVEGIHAGRSRLTDFRQPPEQVLRQHASSLTVAIEPQARAAAKSSVASFTIKATKFHCNRRGTDTIFDPKPEYFFIFSSTAGTTSLTTNSTVFDNVDTGETRNFNSVDGNMWGLTGHPAPLPAGDIGILVTLVEHDSGDPAAVREGVAAAFVAVSGILIATGVAAWVGAVVAGVGGLVSWLTTFMEDDLVADVTVDFDGLVLAKQLTSVGASTPSEVRLTDGNDDVTLTIMATRVS